MIRKACCPLWNAPAAVRMFKESDLSWLSIVQRLALIDRERESVLEQIVQLQSPLETLNYKALVL